MVARTELPGNVQTVNLRRQARRRSGATWRPSTLTRPIGLRPVQRRGDRARPRACSAWSRTRAERAGRWRRSRASRTVTGQLILREPPIPVEVSAVRAAARVAEVLPEEACRDRGAGGVHPGDLRRRRRRPQGEIAIVAGAPDERARSRRASTRAHRGKVGGRRRLRVPCRADARARELGVAAVVVGGFDDRDLRAAARSRPRRRDHRIGGPRHHAGSDRGLRAHPHGRCAPGSLLDVPSPARLRVGERRDADPRRGRCGPEILVPRDDAPRATAGAVTSRTRPVSRSRSLLRVIRQPYFGRTSAPWSSCRPSSSRWNRRRRVRVLDSASSADDGSRAVVPRANVEADRRVASRGLASRRAGLVLASSPSRSPGTSLGSQNLMRRSLAPTLQTVSGRAARDRAAFVLRVWLTPGSGTPAVRPFMVGVAVAGWYGGFGLGLLSTLVSLPLVHLLLHVSGSHLGARSDHADLVARVLTLTGLTVSISFGALHSVRRRLRARGEPAAGGDEFHTAIADLTADFAYRGPPDRRRSPARRGHRGLRQADGLLARGARGARRLADAGAPDDVPDADPRVRDVAGRPGGRGSSAHLHRERRGVSAHYARARRATFRVSDASARGSPTSPGRWRPSPRCG